MKNLLLTAVLPAVLLLLAGPTPAQTRKPAPVPAAVGATFRRAFPRATAVTWGMEHGSYETSFWQGQAGMSALIGAGGELAETETSRAPNALPAAVRQALAARHRGLKVREAARIGAAKTGAVTYEAAAREHGAARDLLFTADGRELPRQ